MLSLTNTTDERLTFPVLPRLIASIKIDSDSVYEFDLMQYIYGLDWVGPGKNGPMSNWY